MRVLIISYIVSIASAMQATTYMKKSEMSDLQSSASGYTYQSGQPFSYVQFSTQPQGILHPISRHPILQPVAQPIVQPINYLKSPNIPIPYVQQSLLKLNNLELQGEEDEKAAYEKANGSEYDSEEKSSKGESGEKGYENKHGYEKGEKGDYAKAGEQGYYGEKGENKKSQHNEGGRYAAHHSEGTGANDGSFSQSDSHKKGHKTTGFHNIYHKDEYKKDHTFYDESDKKGHFSRFGNAHAAHAVVNGGFKKGGNAERAYQNKNYGKKGFHDNGKYEKSAEGHKQDVGNDNYYSNHNQYANKQGNVGEKEYGYSLE